MIHIGMYARYWAVAIVAVAFAITVKLFWPLSADDQREYNYLKSAVYDLEHQTPENAAILAEECAEHVAKSGRFVQIPKMNVSSMVMKYVDGCARIEK